MFDCHAFCLPATHGYDSAGGFVEWDHSTESIKAAQREQNGYLYVKKLTDKWIVEDGASEDYKNHPHSYQTELIDSPDDIVRVPRTNHQFFNYKERDVTHPDFKNWDTSGKTRYQENLQNGSIATYVWFKFIEQPAVKTAKQNHPETYSQSGPCLQWQGKPSSCQCGFPPPFRETTVSSCPRLF